MSIPSFILLDIETTGFDSAQDQIIEIAMVKVIKGTIVDQFESFVHPKEELIPELITHITGIKNADLENAPSLSELKPIILEFIQDLPIVGHNINFDTRFLKAKGIEFSNREWDTFQLATILLPKKESFSLETLTKKLQIDHQQKHRAMGDVKANLELFYLLWEKFITSNPQTLIKIQTIIKRSDWHLQDLFQAAIEHNQFVPEENHHQHIVDLSKIEEATIDLEKIFQPGAELQTGFPNYVYRAEQEQFAQEIDYCFQNNLNLICEAPPGVGKTIGYLIPSLKTQKRVIISTSTRQLQNQLVEKDLPALSQIFRNCQYQILKGKNNYLCSERFNYFIQKPHFTTAEALILAKIYFWLEYTTTGDKDELNLYHEDYNIFQEYFGAEKCHHDPAHSHCFFKKNRDQAKTANILIINHALLGADAINADKILPESDYLIIDEAHKLEDVFSNSLTKIISLKILENKLLSLANIINIYIKQSNPIQININQEIAKLKEDLTMYFSIWILFAREFLNPNEYTNKILLDNSFLVREDYQNLQQSTQNITLKWETFKQSFLTFSKADPYFLSTEIQSKIDELNTYFNLLQSIVYQSDPEAINYYVLDQEGNFSLNTTIKNLSDFFQNKILPKAKSLILTSATLSDFVGSETGQVTGFHYLKNILGLDDGFRERIFDRPFSITKNFQVLILEDIPEPQKPGSFKKSSQAIFDIIRIAQGRTLGLFTSYKSVESVFLNIAPHFKNQGIHIYGQGIGGGIGKIIHAYKHDPDHSILLGVGTFWEGVDFKETPLRCLFINRLPFDQPRDPIIKERMKRFKDSFNEYMIPRSILKFKQGLGRIIRDEDSKGIIIILDSRIITKSYGEKYLKLFPPEMVKVIAGDELEQTMRNFKFS